MRKTMLEMYRDIKESGGTTDFPNLLANTMFKVLVDKFKGVKSPWRQYTMISDLSDFKTADRVIVSEAPDLLLVEEHGPYVDSELTDDKYQIQLQTYGRTFSISRQTIVNDDLNALTRQPARFGRSAARTLVKKIVDQIEGDGLMYDGLSLFAQGHGNSGDTALANTAAGIAALSAAMTAIEQSTEPRSGEKMGIEAKFLLVPPELEDTGLRITDGQSFIPISTGGGTTMIGKSTRLVVLREPFLTSTTGWYVLAAPQDAPVVEVGFLDRKETPDLFLKRADAVNLAGGEDRWQFEFDELVYKVRHDWALARAFWQGIYRGKA